MNLTPMRFKSVTWHHNPKTLKVKSDRRVRELVFPAGDVDIVPMGENISEVAGTGELYGSDCIEQYNRLHELYREGGVGILVLPGLPAMYACLRSLSLGCEPIDGVVSYSFLFERAPQQYSHSEPDFYLTSAQGESLWDIAGTLGVPIEQLVEHNPRVRYVDELLTEERVKICLTSTLRISRA